MQFIFLLFGKKTVFIFYRLFFAGLVKIFGIKLSISGKIKKRNVLYVSNHVSYIDIFLLGSLLDAFLLQNLKFQNGHLLVLFADLERQFLLIERVDSKLKIRFLL